MAGQKISALPQVGTLLNTDEFLISRNGGSYKIAGGLFARSADLLTLATASNDYASKTNAATVSANVIALSASVNSIIGYFPTLAAGQSSVISGLSAAIQNNYATIIGVSATYIPHPSGTVPPGAVLTYDSGRWIAGYSLAYEIANNRTLDVSPVGSVMYFAASAAPMGYYVCDGSSKDTTGEGKDLFDVIKYTYGGSGLSFKVPDLRGEFVRGWDNGRGADKQAGRTLGSTQTESFSSHWHTPLTQALVSTKVAKPIAPTTTSFAYSYQDSFPPTALNQIPDLTFAYSGTDAPPGRNASAVQRAAAVTIMSTGGTETRPRNVALLPCIKFTQLVGLTTISTALTGYLQKPTQASANQILTYNGTSWNAVSAVPPLPVGTADKQLLTWNNSTSTWTAGPGLSAGITNGGTFTFNNTTSVAVSNIPSYVKRITLAFYKTVIPTTGGSTIKIVAGDSVNAYIRAGYTTVSCIGGGAIATSSTFAEETGFYVLGICSDVVTTTFLGPSTNTKYNGLDCEVTLTKVGLNWICCHNGRINKFPVTGSGSLAMTNALDRLIIEVPSNTFTSGSVAVYWE